MRQEIRLLKVYSKKESWKHPFLVHDYVNTFDHFFPFQMNFTLFETFNNDIYPIHTEIFAPKINEINFIPGRTVFVTSEKYRPTNHRPRTALCH